MWGLAKSRVAVQSVELQLIIMQIMAAAAGGAGRGVLAAAGRVLVAPTSQPRLSTKPTATLNECPKGPS